MKYHKLLLILFLTICFIIPVYSFSTFRPLGGTVHESITRAAIGSYFTGETFGFIDTGNTDQDRIPHYLMDEKHHFDNNSIKQSLDYVDVQFANAVVSAGSADENISSRNNTLEYLGRLFHTVQDFYAHSNYVELCLKNGIKPENIKPLYLFGTQLTNPPAGLKTGYFYFSNVYSNEKLRPRKVCVDGLRAQYPNLKFADDAEYYKIFDGTYNGAITYATGDYTLIHEDINKDDESTREGSIKVPGSKYTLYNTARKAAIEETKAQWQRFIEEIKKEYPGKATAIINALTGKTKPKPATIPVTAPIETPIPAPSKTQTIEPFKLSVSANKTEVLPSEKVKVSAMATGGVKPYKYEWYFNGVFSPNCNDAPSVDVWHKTIGEHSARVIVKDSNTPPASVEGTVKFKVILAELKINLSIDKSKIKPGESVKATVKVTGGVPKYAYVWTLDGAPCTGCDVPAVTASPKDAGKHRLTVIVTDSAKPNATAEASIFFTVVKKTEGKLTVKLGADKTNVKPDEKVSITAEVSGGVPPYEYKWYLNSTFHPERKSNSVKASGKKFGKYDVKVEVTDSAKKRAFVAASVSFNVIKPLDVNLKAEKLEIASGGKIKVTAEASGGVPQYKYKWYLDGKPHEDRVNNFVFAKLVKPGKHTVKVEITDSNKPEEKAEAAINLTAIEAQAPLPPKEETIWDPFIGTWKGWAKITSGATSEEESKPFSVSLRIGPHGNTYAIFIGNEVIGDPTGYKVRREGNTLIVTYNGPPIDTKGKVHTEARIDVTLKLTVNGNQMTGGEWFTYTDKETSSHIEMSLTLDKQ